MQKTLFTSLFVLLFGVLTFAQTQPPAVKTKINNLVVNPSFEEKAPNAKTDFETAPIENALGWSSPNLGGPVIFATGSDGNIYDDYGGSWAFKAKKGQFVGGMSVYDSRDYIQGSLSQPLTVGKRYHFWFYVHYHCSGANNIGIAFLPSKASLQSDGVLPLQPAAIQKEITPYNQAKSWALIRDSFVAQQPYQYFIIGNFFPDEKTGIEGSINHYYAYVDDITVVESRDQKTGMPAANTENKDAAKWTENVAIVKKITENPSIDLNKMSGNGAMVLPNILFKNDADELLPESLENLESIIAQMKRVTTLKIRITGHTSSEGTKEYNQKLSEKRAQAIRKQLLDKGIAPERIEAVGMGEERLIITDEKSEEDRMKNRRVEFEVIQ
jgi:outer membrane protein OmpA-like peptidoglycan-associated protein